MENLELRNISEGNDRTIARTLIFSARWFGRHEIGVSSEDADDNVSAPSDEAESDGETEENAIVSMIIAKTFKREINQLMRHGYRLFKPSLKDEPFAFGEHIGRVTSRQRFRILIVFCRFRPI